MSKKETELKLVPAVKRRADDGDSSPDEDKVPKKKLSFGLAKPTALKFEHKMPAKMNLGLKMKLAIAESKKESAKTAPKLGKPASAFADDQEDEEEMPPEAKMRMKNIGRDTPTSSGPNSFGKTKMGFCDVKKIYEKKITEDESTGE